MKNQFILNIVHRPELMPEYAEKANGKGSTEKLLKESFDIFKFQQETAHKNGLKTTIQMTYASLFSDEAVSLALEHHRKYGDEIALSLLGLPCKQFKEKYNTEEFCIWLFSKEDKMAIIDDVFTLFKQKFGFYPKSTGSYYLDAFSINYIKQKYPEVICAIATCWEEGPKAYHTCNNSWYTFMDGGPWNPWIPSKFNTHCPASDINDDSGIVAIPHLSRDLIACFDGNGSNFGTHPQNVIRGMIYYEDKYPYLFNLIDQYRHLAKYNEGYSYNMMFVGPGWLNKKGRWEAPYELLAKSYEDVMAYYGNLKKNNSLVDMTMEEFAVFYRANRTYSRPEVALWKDILYGSNKHYYWYSDPFFRFCLDFNQGGAMIDLRPYVAKLPIECGIGTDNIFDTSYPYLIQSNYRAGFFTHYAGAGTIKSCKVSYNGVSTDLCLTRTMARVISGNGYQKVICNPVSVTLDGLEIVIESSFIIREKSGKISISRKIINDLCGANVTFEEYLTGGFGTNEYQADMSKLILGVDDEKMVFSYQNRMIQKHNARKAYVRVRDLKTKIILGGDSDYMSVKEGIAFSPVYSLVASKTITKGEFKTWLKLVKAN